MYYADNGSYPGNNNHYANATGTECYSVSNNWSAIFGDITPAYIITLPIDPKGNVASWCYGYSKHTSSGVTCLFNSQTLSINDYYYVLTFRAEGDLSDKYPTFSQGTNRYCIFGPAK